MNAAICPILAVSLALMVSLTTATSARTAGHSPAARRAALLKQATQGAASVSALAAALQDNNFVVRRTAVRLLAELGAPAREALAAAALGNSDVLVRRAALVAVCDPPTTGVLPQIRQAAGDPNPLIRLAAVNILVQVKPRTQEVSDLLEQMRKDEAAAVREVAAEALWPFFKESISLRERKDWDHDLRVAQSLPLPLEGWRFQTDPKADGHLQKWYEPDFDDSAWMPIEIGKAWEEQGHTYDGVAWYRGAFDLPAKPQCVGAEIEFGAVDEVAWVWINGQYVGQHDLGPEGWDKTFALDVSKELKWGDKNQITVRVHDSTQAGGIWKPVTIQVLE